MRGRLKLRMSFHFKPEVGMGAVKVNQRNFQATNGQTKTNENNVVEAKGGEDEEINGHKKC